MASLENNGAFDIPPAQVGLFPKTPSPARNPGLGLTVVRRPLPTGRTRPAGIARGHRDDRSTAPSLFVLQLPPELEPALIEDRAVQSGLGADVPARLDRK